MKLWKRLLWILVTALGLGALAVLALSRGEPVNALWIVIAGLCAFSISYRFYSKWLATKVLVLNDERATPAVVQNDGKDFVPTNRWMVFGHHFAAIAGPGPLVGPVLAAQFGFLPGTLWILIGATLGGGVHDMIVLFSSVTAPNTSVGISGNTITMIEPNFVNRPNLSTGIDFQSIIPGPPPQSQRVALFGNVSNDISINGIRNSIAPWFNAPVPNVGIVGTILVNGTPVP